MLMDADNDILLAQCLSNMYNTYVYICGASCDCNKCNVSSQRKNRSSYRLRAKKGPAPPLGNFADISYLKDNFKPHLLRDVCTLCSGALVSDSLLHMLL